MKNVLCLLCRMTDENHPLAAMAMLVRRAGLEHLVIAPSPKEVQALADAGDKLTLERSAVLAKSLISPTQALAAFDGGRAARDLTRAMAFNVPS